MRLALGASRGQILGKLTEESLLLAGLGGKAGERVSSRRTGRRGWTRWMRCGKSSGKSRYTGGL